MARNNTDMKLEAVILSGIVFFSQFFFFLMIKGVKLRMRRDQEENIVVLEGKF